MKSDSQREMDLLVSAITDGSLSGSQAERLQALLVKSPEAVERYLELLDNHEALGAIYPGEVFAENVPDIAPALSAERVVVARQSRSSRSWPWFAVAASLLAVGFGGYFYGTGRDSRLGLVDVREDAVDEQVIAGHAMLRRSVDIQWSENAVAYRDGDVLPGGSIRFDEGIAEIDFFCGASLTVEGPAVLEVESDWSVSVVQGRLRANVPPAARGFKVKAVDSEIIDLGTEFSLQVKSGSARLEVLDGEVELRGGTHDGQHLLTGEQQWLGEYVSTDAFDDASNPGDLKRRRDDAEAVRFDQWRTHSSQFRQDPRLIAYYPIADMPRGRRVANAATEVAGHDGIRVGPVESTRGRFGDQSLGLEFDRVGARVRTRIEGEYNAFSFCTWVRIDSLEHRYNALFMSDGYENGEPHWQIRDDGRLMFSVMVDDTADVSVRNDRDSRAVKDAGLHRVYYTDPIWDIAKSGRWFHLAAVYNPKARSVVQYVNGEPVSDEPIVDKFFVETLRIGSAEIGNWGQPFRNSPWFAVRNLNGTIDELAIFGAALDAAEVRDLYQKGKPLGY